MKHQKLLLPAIFLALSISCISAQITPACPDPAPPGAESCIATCVYCNLNGYQGTNNGTPSGGNTVCGAIAIHNDQWFGFTAGSNAISMDIVMENCQNGDGLQAALFQHCDDSDAIACNPGLPGGGSGSLNITYDHFEVGQTYYLMIDGWSGDVCDYTIIVQLGSTNPSAPAAPDSIQGPSVVCQNQLATYSVSPVINAGYYQWIAPPGSSINGGGNVATLSAPEGNEVTIQMGSINGNICVLAANACNPPSAQVCKAVTVTPAPTVTLPKVTVCNEDVPYIWAYPPFMELVNPGIYNLSGLQTSINGCDTIVKQTVVIKPPLFTNLGNIILCQGDCFLLGAQSFCVPGIYSATLTTANGCDSTVVFQITVVNTGSAAQINAPQGQILNCLNTSLELNTTPVNNTSRIWKNMAGDTLGNGNAITVTEPGLYSLEVKSTLPGASCTGLDKILIKRNNFPPPVTASGGILDANHPTVQLQGNSILSGMQYHWTGPNGFSSNLKKPIVSVPGLYTL
ncbi:MAG: hypothetical protein JNN28_09250, partial [Saprospiraceae bacterium]|nr:hypothetical protein [Saprospiraceae bacterium]